MISCSYRVNRLRIVADMLRGSTAGVPAGQASDWLYAEADRIQDRVWAGFDAALAGPWWEQAADAEGGCPL